MSQDVILAMVAALAGVCLVTGLAQALAPPPRRRRRRRRRGTRVPPHRRPAEAGAAVRLGSAPNASAEVETPASAEPSLPPSRRRSARGFTPRSRPAAREAPPGVPSAPTEVALPRAAAAAGGSAPSEIAPPPVQPTEVSRPSPRLREVELPLAQCQALYEGKQYQEVIATGEPALQRALGEIAGSGPAAYEVAGLWSLLALSRQAVGDEEGARSEFEEAIHTAPEADRPQYQQHLATLTTSVSRRLLARAEQIAEGPGEERIGLLRQAMLWLRQGLAEMPGDGELASALEQTRHGLWVAYGQTVTVLIQRQEFHRARRLIRDALSEEEFPRERRDQFAELLSATFTGEIGQLTASAIRALEDEREGEALTFLQRAEGVLKSVPSEALTSKRREEVNRRLWWGYTKLGMQRVEAGEHEGALEPLFHALRIGEINPERQQETREAIVRALVGISETRVTVIRQLLKEGKRSDAVEEGERLKGLMRKSLELGLSQQELSPAFAKARRAMELIEKGPGG